MSALNGAWTVVDIVGTTLPEEAVVTIEIQPGHIQGMAACNRYDADLEIEGTGLFVGEVSQGNRECSYELEVAQEDFIRILRLADTYRVEENGDLTLLSQDRVMIRAVPHGE